ncbi:hypothetical protein Krac_2668 [Ktedonobacter racemifer DSM 44963]|uniref:Uncharacterized protein n=1 Tax=Ktedonobacter racemifer DSM 44963 TaxID=485913 RepID=D6TZB9_KTERA|nr:hypothetical protein Krac_2668 [Ktedonobacter racemifer DSM 44963]
MFKALLFTILCLVYIYTHLNTNILTIGYVVSYLLRSKRLNCPMGQE